ncbi:MOSC domain-containing protein [Bacillus sp. T33-2]|uniref:MOSC domain-containing protein n=1 Tax=Bacillus sp. T33-2 TaxID=2054168 RepID=UPI000C78BF78|nr:MOSC domain-containing protein [Bacillus sp. T33-2]PLR95059.1 MOSC domain-containing protein [Bacillus sp. T33-2]
MARQLIGEIQNIIRYPVKSFQGEKVQQSTIEAYGLYGDRSHVFIDETKPRKYVMATHFPELLKYEAQFEGQESSEKYPQVRITTPQGKQFYWDDEPFHKEIQQIAGDVYPVKYTPKHVPIGAIEEEHILIVTDSSLTKMEQMWGKQLDFLRFRPNLVIAMGEGAPFAEEFWFGKRMIIGDIELEIKRHCERCMIINIDPVSHEKDNTLLKTVVRERDNHFGVYASVIKTGQVKVGDNVFLEDGN